MVNTCLTPLNNLLFAWECITFTVLFSWLQRENHLPKGGVFPFFLCFFLR